MSYVVKYLQVNPGTSAVNLSYLSPVGEIHSYKTEDNDLADHPRLIKDQILHGDDYDQVENEHARNDPEWLRSKQI